ncbi:MAG: glycosyltransferase family 39 protein [Thermoflexales bacterium]|nr:glycosyltransferase family 39 protein [Thermoflexales bacterium]
MRKRSRLLLASLALLCLAYTLQVHALDRQDLWGDEAVSALVLEHDALQILDGQVDPLLPPLYFLLLRAWTNLAGGSEFAIRYLSLMGTMLAVAFIGRAARATLGSIEALVALALAAVAPFMVFYAQEARMYGLAVAFNAGALWAITAAVRHSSTMNYTYPYHRDTQSKHRDSQRQDHFFREILCASPCAKRLCVPLCHCFRNSFWRPWLAFAVLALGAVWTHYLSFLPLLGMALGLLLAWWRKPRLLLTAAGTAAMMGLLYLPAVAAQMNRLGGRLPFRPELWRLSELARVTRDTLQAYSVGQTLYPAWGWAVVGLMAALVLAGLVQGLRSRQAGRWLPGVVVTVVLVLGWLFSAYLFIFEPRYLIMGLPAYLLSAAAGLVWVGRRWPAVATLAILSVMVAAGISNTTYYTHFSKSGYGRLMRKVAANARPGDLLLLNNPLQRALFEYYRPAGVDHVYLSPDVIVEEARLEAEMARLAQGRPRLWLVMFGDPNEYDPEFRVEAWLATHGAKNDYEGFGDATLSLYVMASAAGASIPVRAVFGDQIELSAYRLSGSAVRPGDTLVVELDWKALSSPERNYTIFVQLLDPAGALLTAVDTQPVGGTRPTSGWATGERVSDRYALLIPDQLSSGEEGTLIVGLYPWPEMDRLPVTEAGTFPAANAALRLAMIRLEQ